MELTNRDFEIIEFLYHQGVATLNQLTDQFFQSPVSARVRIHQLKKNGFLDSKPLSQLKTVSSAAYLSRKNQEIFGSNKDLHKFKVYTLGPKLKHSHARSELLEQPIMWKHQIQLNRIRTFLKASFPEASFLSDPEVRQYWNQFKMGRDEVIPDLVLQRGNQNVAIEVERNQKSALNYYSRFLSYKDSSYSHVIYFCETEPLFNAISEQSSSFHKIGTSLFLIPQNIFQKSHGFQWIGDFLKS